MDRLHSMRVFARVIDEGSFAAAARSLNVSAAVVTRLVADLEAHLGARLIHRSTRRLALTDTGAAYLERVRAILSDVEEADALAIATVSEPKGHLRVLVPAAFAVHQLAKRLPAFHQLCPQVSVALNVTAGFVDVADEGYDVSILVASDGLPNGDFVARLLASTEVVACAAPAYLDTKGRPGHPEELRKHQCLVSSWSGVPRAWRFRQSEQAHPALDAVEIEPQAALSANHGGTLFAAGLAGLGIMCLPSYLIEEALAEGKLERVLPEWRIGTLEIYAAMPSRKYVPARTRAFMDFLLGTFGAEEGDPWLAAARRASSSRPQLREDALVRKAA
jgi:DNA-binding transcriptional LysR family regulator